MSGIFNPAIFNNAIFNVGDVGVAVKTGTGGIDPKRRRTIYKPTGFIERKKLNPAQQQIEEIVQSGSQIHAEVSERLYREFTETKPIHAMTSSEIDREIGFLLKKKLEQDEEEEEMIMLMAMIDE